MKICKKCHIKKDFSDFHKDKKIESGLRADCKLCRKVESKLYYGSKSEMVKKRVNNYRNNNIDIISDRKLKFTNFQPLCSYINRDVKRSMLKNQSS